MHLQTESTQFQRSSVCHDFGKRITLMVNHDSRSRLFPGCGGVNKKRHRFQGLPSALPNGVDVAVHYPHPGWRMLTPFPFEQRGKACLQRQPRLSGSTNPCPTAVHMETFSSSVFKNPHLKNCYYHQDLHWMFLHPCSQVGCTATTMPSYSKLQRLQQGLGISHPLQRHLFSRLVHSGGELLHKNGSIQKVCFHSRGL